MRPTPWFVGVVLAAGALGGFVSDRPPWPRAARAEHPEELAVAAPGKDRWSSLLAKRVTQSGEVAFRSLIREDRALLAEVLAGLGESPAERLDHDTAVAFWINAYHALVLAAVVHGESPETVTGRARMYHWFGEKIAGKRRTLDDLRAILNGYASADPRIHLAVSNGTRGAPAFIGEPYVAERLDAQLVRAARRFVNDPERNIADPTAGRLELSRVFAWYHADFEREAGSMVEFLRSWATRPDLREVLDAVNLTLRYRPFDWHLNAAPGEQPK